MSDSEIDSLRAEVERLRAENTALRTSEDEAPPVEAPAASGPRGTRWRAFFSALCIVIATILVPVSIVAAWARSELVDEATFVQTFAPLADDPDVQQLITDKASAAIIDAVDPQALTDSLFDGIESLGLPERATTALDLLRQPAADGVSSLITTAVGTVVESDAFSTAWQTALIASHRSLVAIASGNASGVVTIDSEGQLGIELGPIIDEVKQTLVDNGFSLASSIPTINTTIVIAQASALLIVGTIYNIAVAVGWWLPIVSLLLFGLGILIARRRTTAVLGSGVGLALGSTVLAAGLGIAGAILALSAGSLEIPADALNAIYYAIVAAMIDTAVVGIFLGVVIAVAAWLSGRWAPAARVRSASASLVDGARAWLQSQGMNTGSFGVWMHRQRVLVRIIVLALTIGLLFLLRPLSIGDIVLTVVFGLVLWLVAALLQRDPDAVPATPDDTSSEPEETEDAPDDGESEGEAAEDDAKVATPAE